MVQFVNTPLIRTLQRLQQGPGRVVGLELE